MNLPKQDLLLGSKYPVEIKNLLDQAESALRTWEPVWSRFSSAPVHEEARKIIGMLNEIKFEAHGGYLGAERKRILLTPKQSGHILQIEDVPIIGVRIEGNYLFDKPTPLDISDALIKYGVKPEDLGDIWIYNDRFAEALCTLEAADTLHQTNGLIREISFKCEKIKFSEISFPSQRITKKLISIEASTRLDAIASAGFGLSRSKIVQKIKSGQLRINWMPTKQASRELQQGDRIQLESKGSIEVISLKLTKRQRWRVEMLRN
tara:strand:+ start:1899 stop:2687 length:789 start_codon:yes stop_codon:yes gene_type:complete